MTIKELFDKSEDGNLTYEKFEQLLKENNVKLADLNEGHYVSRNKYESELEAKTKEIETLSGTISTRDTDLQALQKQLEAAGTDAEKLSALSTDFAALQGKYENDVKAYKKQLAEQAYEFAVKEFAGTKKFTSNAAKRDFIQSMISKQLKMDGSKILGAEDFAVAYSTDNADAFVVETPAPEPAPAPVEPKPQFVGSTPGSESNKRPSLTELMMAKNSNPELTINFGE